MNGVSEWIWFVWPGALAVMMTMVGAQCHRNRDLGAGLVNAAWGFRTLALTILIGLGQNLWIRLPDSTGRPGFRAQLTLLSVVQGLSSVVGWALVIVGFATFFASLRRGREEQG